MTMANKWILATLLHRTFICSFLVFSSTSCGGGGFTKFNLDTSTSPERGVWWTSDNGEDSYATVMSQQSGKFSSSSSSSLGLFDSELDETDDSTRLQKRDRLNLVHFSNKSITCNDGTPAGYYIRKSPFKNNNIWIVFLEGGWYCFNDRSCQNRWMRLRNLMSSSAWPQRRHVSGILSSDSIENPYWWNANHIFVPYCSSDSWSGTVSIQDSQLPFSFMGAVIIDSVVDNLLNVEKFGEDATLILAGSSAGGTGVMMNLDRVQERLNSHFGYSANRRTRVKGISDSGWFIDKVPFVEKNDCQDVILCPPKISLRKGMNLWNARLPEACQAAFPDEPWSCFFGYKLYPTLKAQLFVFQWLFDEAQMLVSNVPTPALRKEEWDFVYKVGDELKKSLVNVTSVMIPSCISHTVLLNRDWRQVEVNSVYLPRALKCWESGGLFEESNYIPSGHLSHHHHHQHPLYLDDDPVSASLLPMQNVRNQKLYAQNTQLRPSYGLDGQGGFDEFSDDTDATRRKRRRHNKHRNGNGNANTTNHKRRRGLRRKKKQQLLLLKDETEPRTSRATGSGSTTFVYDNSNNSNKQRRRNNKKKRNHNSDAAAEDSEFLYTNSRRRHHNHNHARRNSQSQLRDKTSNKISNSNSNSSNRSRDKGSVSNENNSNSINRLRKQRKRRQRRWFSLCDGASTAGSVGVGAGASGSGDMRLIEKCSWPQCNKSCPKLLNPITGEEVDFKDLLRSFGLDLKLMANALGIDIATLNSMDHQVLLQMLTQHA